MDLDIKHRDFPVRELLVYQRVSGTSNDAENRGMGQVTYVADWGNDHPAIISQLKVPFGSGFDCHVAFNHG